MTDDLELTEETLFMIETDEPTKRATGQRQQHRREHDEDSETDGQLFNIIEIELSKQVFSK